MSKPVMSYGCLFWILLFFVNGKYCRFKVRWPFSDCARLGDKFVKYSSAPFRSMLCTYLVSLKVHF